MKIKQKNKQFQTIRSKSETAEPTPWMKTDLNSKQNVKMK